jgi:ubiquinol-cytochrome c reductase cytochrome b subunit
MKIRGKQFRPFRWLDDRLGAASITKSALDKVFPNQWSFLLGEVALYSFVVLVLTGIYLTFFFDPSTATTTYDGSYDALVGVEMSQAYRSAIDISFDVRAGLVMRQMHHWAALVFIGAIVMHLMRVFFTGAFRRPREINWIIGCTLLILAIVNGFAGYSLLDDQLSGTGLRIAYSIVLSIPVAGTWLASLAFGGDFPGTDIIERLFVLHILIVPVIIAIVLGAHLGLLIRHKHTHFPGHGAREDNVVGERLWPTYVFKSTGLFFLTAGVLAALGGLVQINPVWLYGPFRTSDVSTAAQPDWYMGWLEGALRLMPAWEIRAFGYEIPNPFFPGVLLPGLTFALLYAWPFLEAWRTGDHAEHHVLDRPRNRPARTAIGTGTLSFYLVLFIAGGDDVLATTFDLSINRIVWILRVALFLVPAVVAWGTYHLCRELQRRDVAEAEEAALTSVGS